MSTTSSKLNPSKIILNKLFGNVKLENRLVLINDNPKFLKVKSSNDVLIVNLPLMPSGEKLLRRFTFKSGCSTKSAPK